MPFVDHRSIPEVVMRPGITGHFLVNHEMGATGVSLLLNTVDAGVTVPLHTHTVEEAVVMLEGTIWMRVGSERYTVGPNDSAIVPPGTPHTWGNAGPERARMLWAWGGPDPFGDATYLEGEPPHEHRRSTSIASSTKTG